MKIDHILKDKISFFRETGVIPPPPLEIIERDS